MICLLTSAYFAPIQQYCKLYAAEKVWEERCDNYVKQTYRNRCVIAAANGPLALTLPVVRKGNDQPMRDVEISEHGRWREMHWMAIVSAYKQSPYFEYYADDFRPFYEQPCRYLVDFNAALQNKVCELLNIDVEICPTTTYEKTPTSDVADYRTLISPKQPYALDPTFSPAPYYQVFANHYDFLPNLSIIDLLFNMGPESRRVLRDSWR